MPAPFIRRNVKLVAGGLGAPVSGGYEWFCLDWAAIDAFTQQPVGIRRVNVQMRSGPNEPMTSIGLFGIGDVLHLKWSDLLLSVPSVTGNPATEPTYSLDVLAGHGRFSRDLIGRSSNESCVTPRGWFPGDLNSHSIDGIGGPNTVVTAAANVSGVRIYPMCITASGDAANDGWVRVAAGGTNIVSLRVDKADGAVAMRTEEMDIPAGVTLITQTNSARDHLFMPWKLL